MKIKIQLLLALMVPLIFLVACEKNNLLNNNGVVLGKCPPGNIEPYICFDSLITDSRCPKDVVCVWQGTAIIKVSFYEASNVHHFRMSLKGFPALGYPSDTIINGHQVTFTDLTPYPENNSPIPPVRDTIASFIISP